MAVTYARPYPCSGITRELAARTEWEFQFDHEQCIVKRLTYIYKGAAQVMSLFSRSQRKDSSIELDEEGSRARIQAAIDRAILVSETEVSEAEVPEMQVPEVAFFEPRGVQQIPTFENESENAA